MPRAQGWVAISSCASRVTGTPSGESAIAPTVAAVAPPTTTLRRGQPGPLPCSCLSPQLGARRWPSSKRLLLGRATPKVAVPKQGFFAITSPNRNRPLELSVAGPPTQLAMPDSAATAACPAGAGRLVPRFRRDLGRARRHAGFDRGPPGAPVPARSAAPRLEGRLAIVSGRSLADLDRHLPSSGIAFSGSHGLELKLADGTALPLSIPIGLDDVHERVRRFARGERADRGRKAGRDRAPLPASPR